MRHLGIKEFQLYYFVVLNGNDFLKRQKIRIGYRSKPLTTIELLQEIKSHCTTKEDCEKHFRKHTRNELRDVYEKVVSLYSVNQVDFPWSTLTNDVAEVEAIRSKIPEGFHSFDCLSF